MYTIKTMVMVILVVMVSLSWAGEKQTCEKAQKQYLQALNSENQGVRDSAILQIMKMKMLYPEYNYSVTIKKLNNMSQHDKIMSIRTHAYLACAFLQNPDFAKMVNPQEHQAPDTFFNHLYNHITSTHIAMN